MMFYATVTVAAFIMLAKYLAWEFDIKVSLRRNWIYLFAIFIISVTAVSISYLLNSIYGNFIQHMFGGGAAVGIGYYYLIKQLNYRPNWRIELVMLIGLVSILGNLNEVTEFAADLFGIAMFSIDRFDTWRDIVANTAGVLLVYIIARLCFWINKQN